MGVVLFVIQQYSHCFRLLLSQFCWEHQSSLFFKHFSAILSKFSWCSGYHICLTHRRSPVRSRAKTGTFLLELKHVNKCMMYVMWILVEAFQKICQRTYHGFKIVPLDKSSNVIPKESSKQLTAPSIISKELLWLIVFLPNINSSFYASLQFYKLVKV